MKTLFLLITLTQNGAGDINASFVNTESLQQCQQKAAMLEDVFTVAKIPLVENRCIKSDLQFSAFNHASNSTEIRNFYRVQLDGDSVRVSQMSDWRSCMNQQKSKPEQGSVYCSSSVQSFK